MTTVTYRFGEVGYWSGLAAFAATLAYVVVQLLQVAGLLQFPLDEILIYGTSLCIVIPFMLAMLSLHHSTHSDKQFWTHSAVVFTIIYAVFAVPNYVVQLATCEGDTSDCGRMRHEGHKPRGQRARAAE